MLSTIEAKTNFVQTVIWTLDDKTFIEKVEQIFALDDIIHQNNNIKKIKLSSWVSELETFYLIKSLIAFEILNTNSYMKYGDPLWDHFLREICALYENYKIGRSDFYNTSNICFTNWWTGWISSIFHYLAMNKKSKVLTLSPSYYSFNLCADFYWIDIQYISTFKKDFQNNFLSFITDWIDVVIVTNPDNPSWSLYNDLFLNWVIEKCVNHNVLLVYDAVFEDLCFVEKDFHFNDLLTWNKDLDYIKINSFSKDLNLPWLRVGYILSNKKNIINDIWKIQEVKHFSTFWSTISLTLKTIFLLKISFDNQLKDLEIYDLIRRFWLENEFLNESNYQQILSDFKVYFNFLKNKYSRNYNLLIEYINWYIVEKTNTKGGFNTLIKLKNTQGIDEMSFILHLFINTRIKIQTGTYFWIIKDNLDEEFFIRFTFWFNDKNAYTSWLKNLIDFIDEYNRNKWKYKSFTF